MSDTSRARWFWDVRVASTGGEKASQVCKALRDVAMGGLEEHF